ncbi:hypothetical protein POTOM_039371 [Populus tomentosa]|uniref:Uncharacterized protein n=1 Tax=Populus tomentosa TaxID=118781 RepID=A0A8X8CIV2_POPTO|nr:hypothetical protein POTOM_039371 [Populus tomentosa]
MGGGALVWYCRPVPNGVWATTVDNAFGAYTPCVVDSLVICISHLVLLGLCLYRIWLITDKNSKAQHYCLRTNYYNYLLGLLAAYCTVQPLFRLFMNFSIFNLDGQTALAPFEMVSLIVEALSWCSTLIMIGLETRIYIQQFRWYVRFGVIYVLVGEAAMLNLTLSVSDDYDSSCTSLSKHVFSIYAICDEVGLAGIYILYVFEHSFLPVRKNDMKAAVVLAVLILINIALSGFSSVGKCGEWTAMDVLFGILLLVYIPNLDPCSDYVMMEPESPDNSAYEALPGREQICPERNANLFSRICYWWLTPLMKQANKRPISEKDVWKLDTWDQTETLMNKFQTCWVEESQRPKPCLLRALNNSLGGRYQLNYILMLFWLGGFFKIGYDLSEFVGPVVLSHLLQSMQRGDPAWIGYVYAFVIFLGMV